MIICFNCSQETKHALDRLMQSGQYADYSEVIASAITNLLILQTELDSKGFLVFGEQNQSSAQSLPATPPATSHQRQKPASKKATGPAPSTKVRSRHKSPKSPAGQANLREAPPKQTSNVFIRTETTPGASIPAAPSTSMSDIQHLGIPTVFSRNGLRTSNHSISDLPEDVWLLGQSVPLERWLFGQYNKLLPAKANCRALAHLLSDAHGGVPLNTAVTKISEEALMLGAYLRHCDELLSLGRDDALSIAFPVGKEDEESLDKARTRYANQFVAGVNSNGQVSGLLIDLKLINYVRRKDPLLQLTEIGWNFAMLKNPILDGEQVTSNKKFSPDEIQLLLDHISQAVPAEDFAFRTILEAISEGANTPDTLDAALQKHVQETRKLTDSFLSSQRSGAVSRMADLDLVERIREGTRVLYNITPGGKAYLQRPSKVPAISGGI